MLPELDGWEICRMVRRDERKEIREIGILIIGARVQVEDRFHGLDIFDGHITKIKGTASVSHLTKGGI